MAIFETPLSCLVLLSTICSINAGYTLNVRVHSFSSPSNQCPDCLNFDSPGCCDNFGNTLTCVGQDRCDFTFYYCLRPFGTMTTPNTTHPQRCGEQDRFGRLSEVNVDAEELDFTASTVLGLPNPLPLRGLTFDWRPVQLYVEVTDADFASTDEFVDSFSIDVDQIQIGPETTPTEYSGEFGFANITLSFRVECLIANYFPACITDGCENFGNCTCLAGYTGPDCDLNIDDCVGVSCLENSKCVDEIGSYRCECLQGYSGEGCTLRGDDDCIGVDCSGNGRCVDGVESYVCVCEPGYCGDQCEKVDDVDRSFTATPLIALCIAVVLLVTAVLTIITIVQCVLIRRTEKRDSDYKNILKIVTQHNDCYDLPHPATPIPKKQTVPKRNTSPHQEENSSPTYSSPDSRVPILTTPNEGYNCFTDIDYDAINTQSAALTPHTTAPTPEPMEHMSTITNTHRLRPRLIKKLDIYDYDTCIPRNRSPTLLTEGSARSHVDDIQTWRNPGYNCPIAPRERPTHPQRKTAPTPEHESLMSMWQEGTQQQQSAGTRHFQPATGYKCDRASPKANHDVPSTGNADTDESESATDYSETSL